MRRMSAVLLRDSQGFHALLDGREQTDMTVAPCTVRRRAVAMNLHHQAFVYTWIPVTGPVFEDGSCGSSRDF